MSNNIVKGVWHRDKAGKYHRFRRVDGTLMIDRVYKQGNSWYANTGEKGGERIGGTKEFKTRMAATSALDSGILGGQLQTRMEIPNTEVKYDCDGCPGDGIYRGHGYVKNGVFKGTTGRCYRCNGKGYQTEADRRRNENYDNHVRVIHV